MAILKTIQYDDTLAEYNQALVNTLRGFTPKYDFISSWVPDGNLERSVVSLVESAFADDVFEFDLVFNTHTLAGDLKANLEKELALIAQSTLIQQTDCVCVQIRGAKKVDHQASFKKNQVFKAKTNNTDSGKNEKAQLHDDSIYQAKIEQLLLNPAHDKYLLAEPGLQIVSVTAQGVQLEALIDEKGFVHQLAYHGEYTDQQKGVLEGACQWLLDLPLDDIRDNGLALIEYKLRDDCKSRRMAGIQVHFNFSPLFDQLKALLKALTKNYGSRRVNFFDIRNNLNLTDDDTARMAQAILPVLDVHVAKLLPEVSVSIDNIDATARVTVVIEGEASATEKSQLLMDLEVILRKEVHPTIQIYSTLYKDRNTKRQGHEWAIKLD